MKKFTVLSVLMMFLFLMGCSSNKDVTADYTAVTAEAALNEGKDIVGKTVEVTVKELAPDSAFGYNIMDGEHLNFVSTSNPKVEVGDKVIVKVTKVESMLGSIIIGYDDLTKVSQ